MTTTVNRIWLRRLATGLTACWLIAGAGLASAAEKPASPEQSQREWNRREAAAKQHSDETRDKLRKVVAEVRMDATPLEEAAEFIRNEAGADLFVNWRALGAVGIGRQTPVTVDVRGVSAGKALSLILSAAGGLGPKKLAYGVDDGVVIVSTAEDLSRNTITRVYDIRDLIVDIPDYFGPMFTQETPAALKQRSPATRPTREDRVAEIVTLVQETIAPDSWREAGGKVGSMRELNGQLIVSQSPENQRRLVGLLDQLRQTRAVQVTVQTRFLSVDAGQLGARVQEMLMPSPAGKGATFLDDRQVNEALRESQKSIACSLLTAPRLTLFNSQKAYFLAGGQGPYVSGYVRVETEGAAARYEPTMGTAMTGIMMEVQGTASADRKYALLTVRPRFMKMDGVEKVPFEGDRNLSLDRPVVREAEVGTSLEVPDGKTAVLRMASAEEEGKMVYVLLKPTVIVQEESPRKVFPMESVKK